MKKSWICCPDTEAKSNLLVCFRKELECAEGEEARIRIHANQSYKLFWNGELLGRGGIPSCAAYPYYSEWQARAVGGKNCIAVEVYAVGESVVMVTEQNKGTLCLNAEVLVGGRVCLTDASWQCRVAPDYFRDFMLDPMANRISAWGGFKEIRDTRLQSEEWKRADADLTGWTFCIPCLRANEEYGIPERYDLPLPCTEETLAPRVVQTDKNAGKISEEGDRILLDASIPGSFPAVVYDFGREVVGYVRVQAEGERDSSLSLWYGESLDLLRTDTFLLRGGKAAPRTVS